MYYPDDVIEEVRARNDIVDVISQYVTLKKKGANYFGLCPFHNEFRRSVSMDSIVHLVLYGCEKLPCHLGFRVIQWLLRRYR